jgi:hypothetical protein
MGMNKADTDIETSDLDDEPEVEEFIPVELTTTASLIEAAGIDGSVTTVLDRMLGAGIGSERAAGHLAAGSMMVDGERVTDPGTPTAPSARIVVLPA